MRIVFPKNDGIYQQNNVRCFTARCICTWFEQEQDEFIFLAGKHSRLDTNRESVAPPRSGCLHYGYRSLTAELGPVYYGTGFGVAQDPSETRS